MKGKEDKPSVGKREGRLIRSLKKNKVKSSIMIVMLLISLFALVFNNFYTYNNYSKVAFELEKVKKKSSQDSVSLKSKLNKSIAVHEKKINKKFNEKVNILLAENEKLKNLNKQIANDNISLQNSLKIAAMSGIKPKHFSRPPIITSRHMQNRGTYIGRFKGTAYTPSASECGNSIGVTYSGKPIVPGTTIAVDTKYWPIGTVFYIKGLGLVTAMDTGSGVKGKNRFDFAVFNKKFAFALGTRYWDVYLIKKGNGKIK